MLNSLIAPLTKRSFQSIIRPNKQKRKTEIKFVVMQEIKRKNYTRWVPLCFLDCSCPWEWDLMLCDFSDKITKISARDNIYMGLEKSSIGRYAAQPSPKSSPNIYMDLVE